MRLPTEQLASVGKSRGRPRLAAPAVSRAAGGHPARDPWSLSERYSPCPVFTPNVYSTSRLPTSLAFFPEHTPSSDFQNFITETAKEMQRTFKSTSNFFFWV